MIFDRLAHDYNTVLNHQLTLSGEGWDYFADYKARYLQRFLTADFRGKILDFGCGVGNNTRCIKERLPKAMVHGFDLSVESVKAIPAPIRGEGKFVSDFSALDRDYDAVFVANVFHHVPPAERTEAAKRIAGLLKPGGRLILIEHNPLNPATQWSVRHSPIDVGVKLVGGMEARRLATEAGLKRTRFDYIVFFPKPLALFRSLEPALAWAPLGAQYALIATKV